MPNISVTRRDGVATLVVDRPERLNALDRATIAELGAAVRQVIEDPEVRGAIVTGSGEKAFVAGADISELSGMNPVEAVAISREGQRVFREIELSPKPFVAAVNGFTLGGGCELALACHLRVASAAARFGLPEVKLGILPGYGGTVRLPRIVGRGRALEMMLTGAMVDGAEAYRIGLANRLVEPDRLLGEAEELIRAVTANGPLAIAAIVEAATIGAELGVEEGLALESNLFGLLAATEDMREGMAAFLEKRKPEFRGR